jgi:hypothetical protein
VAVAGIVTVHMCIKYHADYLFPRFLFYQIEQEKKTGSSASTKYFKIILRIKNPLATARGFFLFISFSD